MNERNHFSEKPHNFSSMLCWIIKMNLNSLLVSMAFVAFACLSTFNRKFILFIYTTLWDSGWRWWLNMGVKNRIKWEEKSYWNFQFHCVVKITFTIFLLLLLNKLTECKRMVLNSSCKSPFNINMVFSLIPSVSLR